MPSNYLVPNSAVQCVYSSIGINRFSGCSSIIAVTQTDNDPKQVIDILAYAAHSHICIAKIVQSTGEYRLYQTVLGHAAIVRCVRWLCCPTDNQPIYNRPITYLLSADNDSCAIVWACDTQSLIDLDCFQSTKLFHICTRIQLLNCSVPNSVDGYFLPNNVNSNKSTQGQLVCSIACDDSVHLFTIPIMNDYSMRLGQLLPNLLCSSISYSPALCLCMRCCVVNLAPIDSRPLWLNLLIVGLDNGFSEVWCNIIASDFIPDCDGEYGHVWKCVKSATLWGHSDWVRCIDLCVISSQSAVLMIATGGQDNIIRIWRLHTILSANDLLEIDKNKIISLENSATVYDDLSNCFSLSLDSVLTTHENWITGLCWANTSSGSPPKLLSCSMDKSVIIWSPPSDTPDRICNLWIESARLGTFSDTGLGFLDCHWLPSDASKVFAHNYQGSLSIWHFSHRTNMWSTNLPLTGHFGPATNLSWMNSKHDSSHNSFPSTCIYLLTAGADQTVRLHTCQSDNERSTDYSIWYELARPQIHGYDMNAVASLTPTLYVSAGDEKIARLFNATESFLSAFELFKRCNDSNQLAQFMSRNSVPGSAVQPALGLSNQMSSTTTGTDAMGDEVLLTSDEIKKWPTEDQLQHSTLWPEVKKLYGHPYEVYCVAAHPHKLLVASACIASKVEHAYIILWDGEADWSVHQCLKHHQLTVTQLVWSHRNNILLACSRDRTWSLWSMQQSKDSERVIGQFSLFAYPLKGQSHSRIIWTCTWSPDDCYFFTGSRDTTICCWSPPLIEYTPESDNAAPQPRALSCVSKFTELGQAVTAIDACRTYTSGDSTDFDKSYLLAVGLESGSLLLLKLKITGPEFAWHTLFQFPSSWCHAPNARVRRIAFKPEQDDSDADANNIRAPIWLATSGDDGLVRVFIIKRQALLI